MRIQREARVDFALQCRAVAGTAEIFGRRRNPAHGGQLRAAESRAQLKKKAARAAFFSLVWEDR